MVLRVRAHDCIYIERTQLVLARVKSFQQVITAPLLQFSRKLVFS